MLKLNKIIEYLFYAFVFLLPWQTKWIWHYGKLDDEVSQYLSLSLYGTEILLFIILALAIIFKIKKKDEEQITLNIRILDFYILLSVFSLLALMSIFFAPDKLVALYSLIKLLLGFALVVFILNFKFSFKKLGLVFIAAGLIQSLLAIYQFMTQTIWASKWLGMAQQLITNGGVSVVESETMRWLRAYGSLPHPNILAGYLAICLILLIVMLFLIKNKKQQIFLWLSLPILIAGLFFTFSKSASIAFIIGLFFVGLLAVITKDKNNKIIFAHIILVILTISSVLILIYQDTVITRLQGETRLEARSFDERNDYFKQAQDLAKDNFLLGGGLGNYTRALYDYDEEKQPVWYYQPVHNVYFIVLIEMGVLGFIIFMVIIIEIFRRVYHFKFTEYSGLIKILKNFHEKSISQFYKNRLFWFLAYATIFLMLLVIMVFDHYLWTLYFGIMLFWLCLGLLLKQISLLK